MLEPLRVRDMVIFEPGIPKTKLPPHVNYVIMCQHTFYTYSGYGQLSMSLTQRLNMAPDLVILAANVRRHPLHQGLHVRCFRHHFIPSNY